jgi:hypothetical protein
LLHRANQSDICCLFHRFLKVVFFPDFTKPLCRNNFWCISFKKGSEYIKAISEKKFFIL